MWQPGCCERCRRCAARGVQATAVCGELPAEEAGATAAHALVSPVAVALVCSVARSADLQRWILRGAGAMGDLLLAALSPHLMNLAALGPARSPSESGRRCGRAEVALLLSAAREQR